jgi:NAD(P)-dependent dehydrogenase (short-subunit alcohol dehydrogenase family)
MPDLSERLIVVTGAAGGLGPSVVAALRSSGARVAAVGRHTDALASVAGDGVTTHGVDLVELQAARALAESLGAVDGVVHLVGGWRGNGPISEVADDDWAALEGPLLRTVLNVTRAFSTVLQASAHGRFVLVSSEQAVRPTASNAIYATIKAAAETWTRALADEFRERESSATANIVAVRAIVTPAMREQKPDARFPGFVRAEDLAEAICFVVSDAASAMNGQRLTLHR